MFLLSLNPILEVNRINWKHNFVLSKNQEDHKINDKTQRARNTLFAIDKHDIVQIYCNNRKTEI